MTTLPASPASLTDAALDALEEDAGIFLSKETHPQEEYYQRRITRSRTRLIGTQTPSSSRGGGPRITSLGLVNETEPTGTIDRQSESTQLLRPTESTEEVPTPPPRAVCSNLEEQGEESQLPTACSSQATQPLCPTHPPSGVEASISGELDVEIVPGAPGPLNVQSSTDAPLANAVPLPPTPTTSPPPASDTDTIPSAPLHIPQTPSTDLICFDSFQLPSPTRAACTPPGIGTLASQPTDFLCASPATLPPRVPNHVPAMTPDHNLDHPSESIQNALLFTPRTTASFGVDVQVPVNPALLMTRERDNPASKIDANDQETEEDEEMRPAKRAKPETPVKSQNSDLSSSVRKPVPTPSRSTQRGPPPGRSATARSPENGRILTSGTPQRPLAPKTPTRPHHSSIKVLPTPARNLFTTPQRPTIIQRPATGSKAGSVRPPAAPIHPPSATSKLPSDFRFVFQSSVTMPKSPEARNQPTSQKPETEIKPVLLNNFKFVPAPVSPSKPSLSSPAKPSTSKPLGLSTSKKDLSAGVARASPIKFNLALLSPKKAGAVPKSSPTTAERSAYGSPVRFAPPVSSRLNSSSTLHSSTTTALGPFKGKAPVKAALPVVPESLSPLKPLNNGPTVNSKPANSAPLPVKPTALPKPKGFKVSKLPKPAGIPVPSYARTTTVSMVHVPRVDLGGSPTKQPRAEPVHAPRAETIPAPPPPVMPVAAAPPRKKIFRPVIPGTLTGWEGKPATMVETQDKSPTPESPKPPSDSSPEVTSSEADSSNVRRSTRRKVSNTRTPSPELVNDHPKSEGDEQSSPRRSRRISKEKENTAAEDQPAKSTAASRPATASRGRTPATPKVPASGVTGLQMSDKELKSLTMKNTVRNQTYFVEIDLQVIRKDCPRPPSPSTRVRAAIGIEEKEAEAKKRGRTERAKKRGLLEEEMDKEEDESPLKHFRAPGDEEDYETPKRRRLDGEGGFVVGGIEPEQRFAALQLQPPPEGKKSRSRAGSSDPAAPPISDVDPMDRFVKPNSKGRFVRWNKKLAFHCEAGEKLKVVNNSGKSILARDAAAANLDKVGNVPEAGKLPPEIRKNVVVVFKYVYADDPAEIQQDVEMEEEVDEIPSPPKKGKRKRLA